MTAASSPTAGPSTTAGSSVGSAANRSPNKFMGNLPGARGLAPAGPVFDGSAMSIMCGSITGQSVDTFSNGHNVRWAQGHPAALIASRAYCTWREDADQRRGPAVDPRPCVLLHKHLLINIYCTM